MTSLINAHQDDIAPLNTEVLGAETSHTSHTHLTSHISYSSRTHAKPYTSLILYQRPDFVHFVFSCNFTSASIYNDFHDFLVSNCIKPIHNASCPKLPLKWCIIIKNGIKNKNNIQPDLLIQLSICVIQIKTLYWCCLKITPLKIGSCNYNSVHYPLFTPSNQTLYSQIKDLENPWSDTVGTFKVIYFL